MAASGAAGQRWTLRAAGAAGTLLRHAGRLLPGIIGPALVAVGVGMIWLPLGVIAAGAALWSYDLLVPAPVRPKTRQFGDGRPRPVID